MIKSLLGDEANSCVKLNYRGNGWPGMAQASSASGKSNCLPYEESWGKILGRDIRPICRFCMIGMGESADVSCGDAWNLDDNNKPSFKESEGKNIIFGRTDIGCSVVEQAFRKGYIKVCASDQLIEQLKYIQPSQYDRKTTMKAKVFAMKLLGKPYPRYNKKIISCFSKLSSRSRLWDVFVGTAGRIVKHRI